MSYLFLRNGCINFGVFKCFINGPGVQANAITILAQARQFILRTLTLVFININIHAYVDYGHFVGDYNQVLSYIP